MAIPGVQRDNFKEQRNVEMEQKETPAKTIDIEALKKQKWTFEQIQIMKQEMSIQAKDIEFLKVQVKGLMEILNEALNLIESKEQRNKKVEEVIGEEEPEKTIEQKVKESVERDKQRSALFTPMGRGQKGHQKEGLLNNY